MATHVTIPNLAEAGVVILLGGGDAGVIVISANGVHRVPGNNPEINTAVNEIEAAAALSRVNFVGAAEMSKKLGQQGLQKLAQGLRATKAAGA
jgi:hypothetical protein